MWKVINLVVLLWVKMVDSVSVSSCICVDEFVQSKLTLKLMLHLDGDMSLHGNMQILPYAHVIVRIKMFDGLSFI